MKIPRFLRPLLPIARALRSLDNALWRPVPERVARAHRVHHRTGRPFAHHSVEGLEPRIAARFLQSNSYEQEEHLLKFPGPLRLEPARGWGITEDRRLLWESIPFSRTDRPPRPSYLLDRLRPPPRKQIESVVAGRYWMHNYFHFYNDFLGSLLLCDALGVPPEVPAVVPESVQRLPFFQYAAAHFAPLARRPILVQGAEHLWVSGTAWFPKVMPNRRALWDGVLDALELPSMESTEEVDLFVHRRGAHVRGLANEAQILERASREGFQIIDPGALGVADQMRLFRRARRVVGVHGAGLSNVAFRRGAPLDLLEIFPETLIAPHYFWLCREYGYGYRALLGGPERGGRFTLDPEALARALEGLRRSR